MTHCPKHLEDNQYCGCSYTDLEGMGLPIIYPKLCKGCTSSLCNETYCSLSKLPEVDIMSAEEMSFRFYDQAIKIETIDKRLEKIEQQMMDLEYDRARDS